MAKRAHETVKRFAILSGPSCVGKGPLQKAAERFFPGMLSHRPVLYHSRRPRHHDIHGKDFYFLSAALVKALGDNRDFVVAKVRSDWQAIDLIQLEDLLSAHDLVFAEVFCTFGADLRRRADRRGFKFVAVFLLPLAPGAQNQEVVSVIRDKLERRATDPESKREERARSAPLECKASDAYTHCIVNTAGEDDIEEWGEFGTRGTETGRAIQSLEDLGPKARWLVLTFVAILRGEIPPAGSEKPLMFPEGR